MRTPLLVLMLLIVPARAGDFDRCQPTPDELLAWLDEHAADPVDYVVSLFDERQIVLLGERHWVRHDAEFVQRLIPALHDAGVRHLGLEISDSDAQAEVDRLVTAPDFDRDLARRIIREGNPDWCFMEWIGIYEAAWRVNRARSADAEPFRIVHLGYRLDWSQLREEMTAEQWTKVRHKGPTDEYMCGVAMREFVEPRERALIFCGMHHAFTRYRQPELDLSNTRAIGYMDQRLGNLLSRRLGDRVMTVALHRPFLAPGGGYVAPGGGLLDAIMAARGNRPAAFDLVGSPMGLIPDASAYAVGSPDFRLHDYVDGYVFLAPFTAFEPMTIDHAVIDEASFPSVREQIGNLRRRAEIDSPEEYYDMIQEAGDMSRVHAVAIPPLESRNDGS